MSEQGHWIQGVENPREDRVIDIGSRLRKLRKVNELSQNNLERRSGLPRTYISRVESGHVVPTLATLKRWAPALGVGLCELFYGAPAWSEDLRITPRRRLDRQARKLVRVLLRISRKDRRLLWQLVRNLAQRVRGMS